MLAFPPDQAQFLLAVVGQSTLTVLDTGQAEAKLKCALELEETGGVVQAVWSSSCELLYLLRSDRLSVFEWQPPNRLVARSPIVLSQLDSAITCFATLGDDNLLLGSANGDVLVLSDFTKKTKLVCKCFASQSVVALRVQRNWLCAVSDQGQLFLFSLPQGRQAHLALDVAVSTAAFNQQGTLLAVGLATAPRILVFSLHPQGGGAVHLLRTLVVFGPSLVEEELALGGVRDLCFNGSEVISCLFYGKSEPTLFHTLSGRRTTTGSGNFRLGKLDRSQVLGWSNANNLYFVNESGELSRHGFARHALHCSLLRNDFSRFAVLGEDYCSLLSLQGHPKFTRFDVPHEYCTRFGPLAVLAVDDGGDKIAVAGARGFCVYFSQVRKWRRFQSEFLEEQLEVKQMCWLPHSSTLLVVSVNAADQQHAVRIDLFDLAEQRLDAPAVCCLQLDHMPVAVDFAQPNLLLCLLPTGVQTFRYTTKSLTPETHFGKPAQLLGALTHFCLVPSLKSECVLPRTVLLDSHGCCAVLNLESQGDCIVLANGGVADVWTKLDPTLGVIIWSLVDGGLKLWVPSLDPNGEIYQQEEFDIAFDEVGSLPVGTEEDAFICLQANSNLVRASKSPALHGILGWLLRQKRDGLARRVLAERRFSKSSGLVRAALEDLLQGSLLGESKIQVANVINVLGCVPFEMMAAVVARCARQIDPDLWEVLFSIVGQPRDLFHQCLVRFDANVQLGNKGVPQNAELLLIAAELLPIVDADRNDPADGPMRRTKLVLVRCPPGGKLHREVSEYANKRGLGLDSREEDGTTGEDEPYDLPEPGVVSAFFASFFA